MKKSIICTILALTMILAGTGYAYWAETLNVTAKATTGDFDVTFVDLGLYAQYNNEYNDGDWSIIDGIGDDGYVKANFFERGSSDYNAIARPGSIQEYYDSARGYNNVNFNAELLNAKPIDVTIDGYNPGNTNGSDNILLTVNNMYPGYAQAFRTDIANTGTLAARLSDLKFDVSGIKDFNINQRTKDMLGIAVLVEREYQVPGEEGTKIFELCKSLGLSDDKIFEIGNVHFIRLSALDEVTAEAIENANLLALPNTNRMDLYLAVGMDPDAEGKFTQGSSAIMSGENDQLSQEKGAKISIDLLWDQFNEGINPDTTNRLARQNHN